MEDTMSYSDVTRYMLMSVCHPHFTSASYNGSVIKLM
jgi:hypothetical protein